MKLMVVDVKTAHLNAPCDEEERVELPEEHGRYAMLRRWLYGTRKAASVWEDDNSRRLTMDGFRRSRAAMNFSHYAGGSRRARR